jgi:hypothetical protein
MAMSEADVAAWLRSQGVSESVIRDEAAYVASKYADADENPMSVLQSSLPSYLQRTASGSTYRTTQSDPAVTVGGYTAPARTVTQTTPPPVVAPAPPPPPAVVTPVPSSVVTAPAALAPAAPGTAPTSTTTNAAPGGGGAPGNPMTAPPLSFNLTLPATPIQQPAAPAPVTLGGLSPTVVLIGAGAAALLLLRR